MAEALAGVYKPGDEVEVWSNSRQVWFVGTVEEVAPAGGKGDVAAGCVKVRFGKKLEKWVLPRDLFRVLRRHVPREAVSEATAPPPCVLRLVRARYFVDPARSTSEKPWGSIPGGTDGDGSVVLSVEQLAVLWRKAVQEEEGRSLSSEEDAQVLRLLRDAAKAIERSPGKFSVDEWMHYSLLKTYPPGRSVKEAIRDKVRPRDLPQMTSLWMLIDTECTGRVAQTDLVEALGSTLRSGKAAAEEQAKAMLYDLDGDGIGRAQYCDFVVRFLRLQCNEVCLYWYDLSNNWAKYISPLVLWYQELGIWHTGVVVFGREFYYSGRIYKGRPGATPFGIPSKIQRLGLTLKTVKEVESYFYRELDANFTEANYDILENNCNHFSDQASLFMLGQQIPEEIRRQPERAMNAPMVRLFRPMLNQYLGRVEGDSTMAETDEAVQERLKSGQSALKSMSRGRANDGGVLMYMVPGANKPAPAKVTNQNADGSLDIIWYGPTGVGKELKRVPPSMLRQEVPKDTEQEAAACCMM